MTEALLLLAIAFVAGFVLGGLAAIARRPVKRWVRR